MGPHVKWRLLWRVCLSREESCGPHLSMRWGPRAGGARCTACTCDFISEKYRTTYTLLVTLAFADLLQHHGQSARKFADFTTSMCTIYRTIWRQNRPVVLLRSI
uniref:Uncharacterized protein n=1 Tax=Oryza punctata TaxID=4537 RepID=A0A0E0K9M6_ORYPU